MESKIKNSIFCDNKNEMVELLNSGLDPNFEGGWPIRLAARHGAYSIVQTLIQYGANPHLLGESGASTLQLAVYSGSHWDTDKWTFLLSYCDSSQLADGAAVAIIFRNVEALRRLLETGRCNTNIATTLTGKTVEDLAKGYKLQYLLDNITVTRGQRNVTPTASPRVARVAHTSRMDGARLAASPQHSRNLSPSVANFFNMSARQMGLAAQQRTVFSPTQLRDNTNY